MITFKEWQKRHAPDAELALHLCNFRACPYNELSMTCEECDQLPMPNRIADLLLTTEFQIGDRVRSTGDSIVYETMGKTATIVDICYSEHFCRYQYTLQFDEPLVNKYNDELYCGTVVRSCFDLERIDDGN